MGDAGKTEHDKYLENGRFKIEIPGCDASAKDVVSIRFDPWKIHILDVTHGNDWEYRRLKPGQMEHMTVEIQFRTKDDGNNDDVKKWHEDCRLGKKDATRKDITVKLYERFDMNKSVREYGLKDCFATFFDAGDYSPDSEANLATLKVNVGRVEFK